MVEVYTYEHTLHISNIVAYVCYHCLTVPIRISAELVLRHILILLPMLVFPHGVILHLHPYIGK